MTATRLDWQRVILPRAAEIVGSYATGVTLRQLFYRLVSEQLMPNTPSAYKTLSARSAEARREGWFPALFDRTRVIHRLQHFDGPEVARDWLADVYRRDRTEGQKYAVYIGVEKHGLVNQLEEWFSDYGIPILALGGYSSQTFVDEVIADIAQANQGHAVLLYAGDFDPSGEDIPRDFVERSETFDEVVRVALTAGQVEQFDLPPAMGKAADSRASQFVAKYGRLVQVEVDALPPDTLRSLFNEALSEFWDMSTFEAVMEREERERQLLTTG